MTSSQIDPARLTQEAHEFITRFRTLLMATVSADGTPEASYAPFIRSEGNEFYVYVSGLARHTRNLLATRVASVLFIEDERDASQAFARKRLTLDCRAETIARESAQWNEIIARFSREFGEVMELIGPLPDFQLFRLMPQSATYVRGFAQAYRASTPALDRFEHIRDATRS